MSYDTGGFGLFFSCDAFEHIDGMATFEEHGAYGNGYGWESVIVPAFERAHPQLAGSIEYDSEAESFVARAATEAPLDALAEVIAAVTASKDALVAALAQRDADRD